MGSIIIAGGSGYIGQEVVRAALETRDECYSGGHRVVNIDVCPPPPFDERLTRNGGKRDFNADPRVKFIQADLSDARQTHEAFQEALAWAEDCECAGNLVGRVSYGVDDQVLYLPNVQTVQNIARECADRGLFMMHLSGTAVHGNRIRTLIDESAEVAPVEAYGRSKVASERAILAEVAEHGLRALVFRATAPIGPGLGRSEMNKLFESIVRDPLVPGVRGSGVTYVSSEDVGRAYVFAMENSDAVCPREPQTIGDMAYNLSVDKALSDAEVVKYIQESLFGKVRKPVIELPGNVVLAFAYAATFATRLVNLFLRTKMEPIVHYELARLFKGRHEQDTSKFRRVFGGNGFRLKHDTPESVLDAGIIYKCLTEWEDRPRTQRVERLLEEFRANHADTESGLAQ